MNRRQSIRVFLGALFLGGASEGAVAQQSSPLTRRQKSTNARLIKTLSVFLEQAKSGELTSLAAVAFYENGSIDHWSEITRKEDEVRVAKELKDF